MSDSARPSKGCDSLCLEGESMAVGCPFAWKATLGTCSAGVISSSMELEEESSLWAEMISGHWDGCSSSSPLRGLLVAAGGSTRTICCLLLLLLALFDSEHSLGQHSLIGCPAQCCHCPSRRFALRIRLRPRSGQMTKADADNAGFCDVIGRIQFIFHLPLPAIT